MKTARFTELDAIYFLHHNFDDAWGLDSYFSFIESSGSIIKWACDNQVIQGAIVGRVNSADESFELFQIYVAPKFRRLGIAQKLMTDCTPANFSTFLELRETNTSALEFYESLGFEKLNEIKDFYQNGASAIRMCKLASNRII